MGIQTRILIIQACFQLLFLFNFGKLQLRMLSMLIHWKPILVIGMSSKDRLVATACERNPALAFCGQNREKTVQRGGVLSDFNHLRITKGVSFQR